MKKHLILSLLSSLLLQLGVSAQQNNLQLVSTAGGFIQSAQGSVSFSIGEPVIGMITGGGFTVNQGFQQPEQISCTISGFNPFPATLYSKLDSLKLDAGTGLTKFRWSTGVQCNPSMSNIPAPITCRSPMHQDVRPQTPSWFNSQTRLACMYPLLRDFATARWMFRYGQRPSVTY